MSLQTWLGKLFTPHDIFDSVFDITPAYIKKHAIKGIILDLDNTILPRTEYLPSLQCLSWITDLKNAGIKLCIATNNSSKERVIQASNYLDVPAVYKAQKPLPYQMRKVVRDILRLPADQVLMAGDQFFTDIAGGNLLGLRTVYIEPMAPERSLFRRLLISLDKSLYLSFSER